MTETPFDLERARRETPACERVLHFNNAGASLMPAPVLDAVVSHLELEAEVGGYEAEERERDRHERVYDLVARLINCAREEVAVVENATRAWDMAFYSLPLGAGDRILTSRAEYASNYIAYLQAARRKGVQVEPVPSDETGQLSVEHLRSMMDERVRLIAVTHVPTNGGLVNPAAEVGRVAREWGVPFLLDACQSVGQMPIDVEEIGCDMLSATGRKFLRGPRAVGFLYVRRSMLERLEPVLLDMHAAEWIDADHYRLRADARRFENWETNYATKLGLAAAVEYALSWGLEAIETRVTALASDLRARLGELPGVVVRDLGARRCGIVTFTVDSVAPEELMRRLAEQRINVTISRTPGTRLDMEARGLEELVRASVHYYNSEAEVARFCEAVAQVQREASS
ncbi:MAG TPA: aminotransferase class V-fold PLP-dependent enzyme [Pyrinomonadaceae bacterium]|nr:aminotransferase class V-fold PLP-dependent enzyme [Pyrinomonadaceae bacterium]